jgi:dCMP deaminase
MSIANAAAELGTCPRANVGCCLVKDNHVIATGYNGSIPGQAHCTELGCMVIDGHCQRTLHAEQNAILDCARRGISSVGTVLYTTHYPCMVCTRFLLAAGVSKIIYLHPYRNEDNPFFELMNAEQMNEPLMRTEKEVRISYEAFKEKHKGNFLQLNEYEACIRLFEWVLNNKEESP